MRCFINLVESIDADTAFFMLVHGETPLRRPLRESRRPTLIMEGSLSKKIAATAARVVSKYGDVQYDLLARFTNKALDLFQGDERIARTLRTILTIAAGAATNRALLAALAGMVGVLIGFATSPGSAQTASTQIDNALSGSIDDIIQRLQQSRMHVSDVGLPAGLDAITGKAVAALKAIQDFEFSHGLTQEATRHLSQSVSIDADITRVASRVIEDIVVRTPDGQIVIANIHTVVENGRVVADETSGVRFELLNQLGRLSPEQQQSVDQYLSGQVVTPNGEGILAMLKDKSRDLALLVAALAANPATEHVSIGGGAVKVRESVRTDVDSLTPQERRDFDRVRARLREGNPTKDDYQTFFILKNKTAAARL